MTLEKEQLETAVDDVTAKIQKKLHLINDTVVSIDADLEDLQDISLILGRIDEPTEPWEKVKKRLKNDR